MSEQRVAVTVRALIQRVNRALAKKDEKLLKSRTMWDFRNLGDYYLIDTQRNVLISHHIELERFGIDEGVLKPHEYLVNGSDEESQNPIEPPEEKERSINKLKDVIKRIEHLEREISKMRGKGHHPGKPFKHS